MKECTATLGQPTQCKENKLTCRFTQQEGLGNGGIAMLIASLNGKDDKYLDDLANDRMGTSYNLCQLHNMISREAAKILKSRH